MVKHSKKPGKKGNVNRKIQSRKRGKKSGKQGSRLGKQGSRPGRPGSMRSVKPVRRKKKPKMQRGGDPTVSGTIYAYYYIPNDESEPTKFEFSPKPIAIGDEFLDMNNCSGKSTHIATKAKAPFISFKRAVKSPI